MGKELKDIVIRLLIVPSRAVSGLNSMSVPKPSQINKPLYKTGGNVYSTFIDL
jgi:hypothetical protein